VVRHCKRRSTSSRSDFDEPEDAVRLPPGIAPRQEPRRDGSFVGVASFMKEDDPLVATLLGLTAVSAAPEQP
jgi:hypothetical protein